MRKLFTNLLGNLFAVITIAFLSLLTSNVTGQQVIGSFPTMDGGFEGQASSGSLTGTSYATGYQSSVWTTSSGSLATFQTSSPRTGGKYVNINYTSTTKRLQSPTASDGLILNATAYTVQFYYRTAGSTAPGGGNQQVGISPDGTGSIGSYTLLTALTATNGTWTKVTATATSGTSTASPKYGYLCPWRTATAMAAAMDIDDVVMYAGAVDNTAPDPGTSPGATTAVATQMNVSWTAPVSGVDGGGYMVVRGLADPTTAPNVNGIYAIGNTVAAGEQVVYLGTNTSFTDLGLTPSTHYYYRIYTVDKAFNYSSAISADASTTAPSYASEPTTQASNVTFANITSTGFDINFTAGDGTNNIVLVKSGSAVDGNPSDGNSYSANTVFGTGIQIGTGNYVVYNGTGTTVTVTGLTKATSYFVKVFSFNGSAGSENYLITNPASGNQLTLPGEISSTGANTAGVTWATASAWVGGVVPGPNDNVTIVTGDKIQLAAAASCYNLTVNSGGKLYNNNNLVGGSMVYLNVFGNSATIEGTLGDKIDDGTADCAFGMRFNGDLTINGSGVIRPARFMPNSNTTNATLTFNANAEMTYMGSTGTGGAGIYTSNSGNDNITVTVNAGKTLSFVNNSHLGTSSGAANGTASTTFNIDGTLNLSGANSNLSMYITTGKTCTLNVGSSGVLNIGNNLNVTSLTGGAAPSISNAGTITVGGIADFSSTTLSAAVTGSGTFTLASGATIKLAATSGLEPVAGPIRTSTRNFNTGANYTYIGTVAQVTGSDLPSNVNNLTVSNTAGVALSGATTINGTLTVDAGSVLTSGANTLTNNGTANINGIFQLDEGGWATGTDFVYGAAGTLAFNNSTGFYGVSGTPVFWPTTYGPVNVTVQNTGGMQLEVPRAVTGIFQTSAGVKNTFGNNLTVLGTVKLNTGGYFDNFSPTYTNTSTLEYNTGGNYGTYNEWIEGATVGYGVPQNVTLSNSTTVDLSGNRTVMGNLSLSSGDMNTNGKTLILAGTTSGSGSILTGTTGMVSYDGTAPQTISNLKDNTVNQLAINNLAGVSLSAPTTAGSLLLVSGDLFLGANDLTLLNPSGLLQIHPVPSMSYIVTDGIGKIIKMVIPGPVNLIPVGASATSYDPVNLSPAAPALFSVNVSTTLPADAPAQYTYAPKVWDISVVAGPPPPSTTVTLTPSNPVATVTSDVIGHYTGGAYTNETATRSGNDYTATFTSFSPFVTGTYDIGTSVSRTVIDGISFDGRTVYNPANISLQVYDAAGRLTVSSTKNINMSSYPKGIYIVRNPQGTQKIALMK